MCSGCGSLVPETYNYVMQPLRLERVQPKLEEILRTFPGKVHVSVPITTRNGDEAGAIRDWFMERGARLVVFDPISSRCAEDRRLFDSLALNPRPTRCSPVIMDDLIVDCDGQVLICCQDFRRVEGIGSLADKSFADILVGVHRENTRKLLAENRHQELATCSRCYADLRGEFVPARRLRTTGLALEETQLSRSTKKLFGSSVPCATGWASGTALTSRCRG
jgi:hypothetical protein